MFIVPEPMFEVVPNSNTDKAIDDYQNRAQKALDAWASFCRKYGSENYFAGNRLEGLIFENGACPDGWTNSDRNTPSSCYRPSLRDKQCAEAAAEYKSLPSKPNMMEWMDALGVGLHVGDNRSMKSPGFKTISGKRYLTGSPGCGMPDDVRIIPHDELVALHEQAKKEEQE